jgi:plasmid stabilization system protein ParE
MKLRFTERATQDLVDIADYLNEHSPHSVLRVRDAILESLQNLVLFPNIGRQQTLESVRKLVTRRYPYLVYYTPDEEAQEIIILTIRHPARERDHSDA